MSQSAVDLRGRSPVTELHRHLLGCNQASWLFDQPGGGGGRCCPGSPRRDTRLANERGKLTIRVSSDLGPGTWDLGLETLTFGMEEGGGVEPHPDGPSVFETAVGTQPTSPSTSRLRTRLIVGGPDWGRTSILLDVSEALSPLSYGSVDGQQTRIWSARQESNLGLTLIRRVLCR